MQDFVHQQYQLLGPSLSRLLGPAEGRRPLGHMGGCQN